MVACMQHQPRGRRDEAVPHGRQLIMASSLTSMFCTYYFAPAKTSRGMMNRCLAPSAQSFWPILDRRPCACAEAYLDTACSTHPTSPQQHDQAWCALPDVSVGLAPAWCAMQTPCARARSHVPRSSAEPHLAVFIHRQLHPGRMAPAASSATWAAKKNPPCRPLLLAYSMMIGGHRSQHPRHSGF